MSAEHSLKQLEKQEEILTLIETLHQASQRLEELTGGEIDTVSSREGRKFMLHYSHDRLHEAELVRQAAILNALNARIALLDKRGVILSVNDAWRRYGAENMLQDAAYCAGCNYLEICDNLPEEFDEAHRIGAGIRDVMSGEKKCISVEYPCHTPTEELWFQATVTPLDGGSPHRVVVAHEDITSRKSAENRLLRLNHLHCVLSKVGELVVRTHNRQTLYESICRTIVEYGLLSTALIAHVDADAKPVRPATLFSVSTEYPQESVSGIPSEIGMLSETIVETAIRTRRNDFCNNIERDPRTGPWRDATLGRGLLAYAAFPLISRSIVVAVLILYTNKVNYFQDDEISLLDAVANEISFAIEMLEIEQERLAAEQQFHRSAGLLSMASRMGRLGAWTLDMPSRKITWSDEVFAIYERPLDYVPKLDNALDSYPPEFRPKITNALNGCMKEGTSFDLESQIITATGKHVWVRVIGEALRGSDGEIQQVRGAFQDISDQKRTEEGLRLSEERFRSMFVSANTGIAVSTADGRYIQVNAAYCRMLGYSESELLGRNFSSVTHQDDLADNLQLRDELVGGQRESFVMEKRYLRKNGEIMWTRHSVSALRASSGEVLSLMVIAEDITERKQTRDALLKQQTELRALFDLMPAMLCIKDTSNHLLQVNQRLADSTGMTISEIEGKSATEIYPNEAEKYYADDLQVINSRLPKLGIVEELRDKEGNTIWVQTDKVPYYDQHDKVIGLVVLSQDITERKREQDELRELNLKLEDRVRERTAALHAALEEAEQANRAKSDFLAAMSHEIRTPMNGVIGIIDVIYQSNLQSYQLEMLDLVRESGFALLRIVDDILDFSKIEAGRLEIERTAMSIADVVERAAGVLVHLTLKKKAVVVIFVDPKIPQVVMGDALRLRQVVINLISNAIKFSSGREQTGQISVRATLISADAERAEISIQVADNGIGMDEKTLARLFTAFSQADSSITRRFGGTGLGLAISHNLVELMQGEFHVHSVLGQGTTFSIRLPVALPATLSEAEDSGQSDMLPNICGLSCLLIGNPDELVGNIAAYLSHGGARLEQAMDLAAARIRMQVMPPGRWIWLLVVATAPMPLSELRALAQSFTEHEIHIIVIDRATYWEPQAKFANLTHVGGNILTRRNLLLAVSSAAGLEVQEKYAPEHIASKMESALPARDDAEHNGRLILVAEDNETNQMVVLRQLALLGFAADIAESGSRALELWRQGSYALILSDLHMPDMDGYQLAAQIRLEERGSKHIPIVALTADALKGQDARCRQAGMDDYLSKPLRIAALEAILNKWLTQGHTEAADSIENSDLQSNHPVSDTVDLNILRSFIGDETSAISDFVQSFRINSAKQSIALKDACLEGNMPQAKKSAHTLKSSAHYIGALVLSAICAEMEIAANFDDMEAIAMLLPKFEHEFGRVIEFLDSLHLSNADPNDGQ